MHDIPSLFSQKTKKNTWNIFICRNLQHFSSRTYARAKQTNKQTNKRTNKRTNKKRNREKTENVASPFLRPSSLLNYRRTVNVDNCKFFEDEDFVFSTKAIP